VCDMLDDIHDWSTFWDYWFTNMNPGHGFLEFFDSGLGDTHPTYFFY
jgi:hypothetical protein